MKWRRRWRRRKLQRLLRGPLRILRPTPNVETLVVEADVNKALLDDAVLMDNDALANLIADDVRRCAYDAIKARVAHA